MVSTPTTVPSPQQTAGLMLKEIVHNNNNSLWLQHQGEDLVFPIEEQHERKGGVDDAAITTRNKE